jgi:hypothetical protein
MAAATPAERDIVEFPPNVPVRISGLKYRNGKLIDTRGGQRMMYSCTDGRIAFTDLDTGAKINLLDLQPRESFYIRKNHTGQKGALTTWDVWKDDGPRYEAIDEQPPEPPSELEIQLKDSIHQVQARKIQQPAPAPIGAKPEASAPISPCQEKPIAPAPVPTAALAPAAQPPTNGTRPRTKLEDALKTVVAAIHATNEYAKSIGYAMPQFTSEDLRCMANTILIGEQNRGAR